jgi:tRNA1Val (adenine37-N6)-methyltransferase
MKVGTDAVLLGAWTDVANAKSILDIGTGCGVIALMLAQRAPSAAIDAVEPDEKSAAQASENFSASPWPIKIHNVRIQDYEHEPYDLIVSNPPFFSNSLLPPTAGRTMARHTTSLSHEELLASVSRLLAPGGRLALIVPGNEIIGTALRHGLECNRITEVYPRQRLERHLLEFSRYQEIPLKDELVLHNGSRRSDAYNKLTEDFYLGTF